MVFNLILTGTLETLYMVFLASVFSLILGIPIGILAVITREGGIYENSNINKIVEFIINFFRAFPYIILMIVLLPLARFIVGTTIGSTAAIVPLAISAAPFVARIIEGALIEVDKGLIEASQSMGANNWQILTKVMIPEAAPALIHGITVTVINLIGLSAMAGAIGGGGLGDIAIRFGYQRFKVDMMIYSVVIIIILVQLIQLIGNCISNKIKVTRGN